MLYNMYMLILTPRRQSIAFIANNISTFVHVEVILILLIQILNHMNIFIFRYGLLIIDDLPLRIGQGRNILRTRVVKVTYNLHLTPILLIEEIMACISINHHLLLFT